MQLEEDLLLLVSCPSGFMGPHKCAHMLVVLGAFFYCTRK